MKLPRLRVSPLGVVSVDSKELALSDSGRKQIAALGRLMQAKIDADKNPTTGTGVPWDA